MGEKLRAFLTSPISAGDWSRTSFLEYFTPVSIRTGTVCASTVVLLFVLTEHLNHVQISVVGRDSSVGIATRYGLDGPGSDPGGGEIFRTRSDRPWGPPILLYNEYRVFPGGKAAGACVDHPPPSSVEVKERVELYLYFPFGPS